MSTISERLRDLAFHAQHGNERRISDEAADTIDALVAKLKEARGHSADVAAAGMLIGDTLPETHTRVSEKGRALLAVIDAALAMARKGE